MMQTHTPAALFCDVVVEGIHSSTGEWQVPNILHPLIGSLGKQQSSENESSDLSDSKESNHNNMAQAFASTSSSSKAHTASGVEKLQNLLQEFVETERSYVKRLQILKDSYYLPLKSFAESKATLIVPKFEINAMFSSIDNICKANKFFLADFEKAVSSRSLNWGKVIEEHMHKFAEPLVYPKYLKDAENGRAVMREHLEQSKSTGLTEFADRTKASTDPSIDLSGLLMAPVQRIPLYVLLLESMVRVLPEESINTSHLKRAIDIASSIAQCKTKTHEVRAAIMYALQRSIEGCPADIYSSDHDFIDCIDVIDTANNTPCTLFLFSHKVLIAKRLHSSAGGRSLAGIDKDLGRIDFSHRSPSKSSKASKRLMTYKGFINLNELSVSSGTGNEFLVYLHKAPSDQKDRWSHRLRRYHLDSMATSTDKSKFIENLTKSQAFDRLIEGKSITMMDTPSSGPPTLFNIYERRNYLVAKRKAKMVLQLDPYGETDDIPFGDAPSPHIAARVVYINESKAELTVRERSSSQVVLREVILPVNVPRRISSILLDYGVYNVPPRDARVALQVPHSRTKSGSVMTSLFGSGRTRSMSKTSTLDSHTSHATSASNTSFSAIESPSTAPTSVAGSYNSHTKPSSSSNTQAKSTIPSSHTSTQHPQNHQPHPSSDNNNYDDDDDQDSEVSNNDDNWSPSALVRSPTRPMGPRAPPLGPRRVPPDLLSKASPLPPVPASKTNGAATPTDPSHGVVIGGARPRQVSGQKRALPVHDERQTPSPPWKRHTSRRDDPSHPSSSAPAPAHSSESPSPNPSSPSGVSSMKNISQTSLVGIDDDESAKSLRTIRELQNSLNAFQSDLLKESAKEGTISLSRSPCTTNLRKKVNGTNGSDSSSSSPFINGSLDLQLLQAWLIRAAAHLRDLEIRWLDQASKEEEIHNGVHMLTSKMAKSEAEIKELKMELKTRIKEIDNLTRLQTETEDENIALYESFNTELERLFQEATLPSAEAYTALSERVIKSQKDLKTIQSEAGNLKRELEKERIRSEQYWTLLRDNNLI